MKTLVIFALFLVSQVAMASKVCRHDPKGFDFEDCGRVGDKMIVSAPGLWISGNWYLLSGVMADSTGRPPSEADQQSGKVTPISDQICQIFGGTKSVYADYDQQLYPSGAFLNDKAQFASIGEIDGWAIAQITCALK